MFSSEIQHITHCLTSEQAFRLLRIRHEKHSGLTQIQLIQKIMVASYKFDTSPTNFDTHIANMRDMIYCADQIGRLDLTKLAVLFAMFCIRSSFPSVHEALTPALMDGSLTLEAFEARMHYFYEMTPPKIRNIIRNLPALPLSHCLLLYRHVPPCVRTVKSSDTQSNSVLLLEEEWPVSMLLTPSPVNALHVKLFTLFDDETLHLQLRHRLRLPPLRVLNQSRKL